MTAKSYLSSGGYKTHTTKDRLNKILPYPFRLSQVSGLWVLYNLKSNQDYPFCDGLTIDAFKNVSGYDTEYNNNVKLRKDIKKYAKGFISALITGKVKRPDGGDCWNCLFREVNTNKPMGEFNNNTDHLTDHIREKYYVPSLFYRAVELYPMSIISNSIMHELWVNDTLPDNWAVDILREQSYKSLVKYLYSQFNLPY